MHVLVKHLTNESDSKQTNFKIKKSLPQLDNDGLFVLS